MKKLLTLVALALCTTPAFAADKPVVKIGASIPLTGDNAHLGEGIRDAMILAKENLPADTQYDYELIFEDDMIDPKKAAIVSNKLISVDKVDAIASMSSATGGVISPIAQQNRVFHFAIASAQSVADGEYNFIHWTPPVEEVRVLTEALKEKGITKIAIINYNNAWSLETTDEIKKAFDGTAMSIISEQTANPGEKDFRTLIFKAKATAPEIYILLFYSPELEILAKQIREAGIETPITSIEGFSLSNSPELYEGMWYVDSAMAQKGFNEKYTKRFNKAPQAGTPNAYDIFNLIVKGYEEAGTSADQKPAKEDIVKALHSIKDFDGVLGKLTVDDHGVVISPATVKIIKDGKPVLLEE